MQAFILTEADFEKLLLMIDSDPLRGSKGGSSVASVRDGKQDMAFKEAHGFYNYQIRRWIDEVKK